MAHAHCKEAPGAAAEEQDAAARQQDALAEGLVPLPWQGTSVAPVYLLIPSVLTALGTTYFCCVVLLENWGSGKALATVRHMEGEMVSHCEEPWTGPCLPLGPPVLHGTLWGQPLSLNSPPTTSAAATSWGNPRGWGDKNISRPGDRVVIMEKPGRDRLAEVLIFPSVLLVATSKIRTVLGAEPCKGNRSGSPWDT